MKNINYFLIESVPSSGKFAFFLYFWYFRGHFGYKNESFSNFFHLLLDHFFTGESAHTRPEIQKLSKTRDTYQVIAHFGPITIDAQTKIVCPKNTKIAQSTFLGPKRNMPTKINILIFGDIIFFTVKF